MTEFRQSALGRLILNAMFSVARKQEKAAQKLPDGPEKDSKLKGALFMYRVMESNSPRSLSMCAGSRLPFNMAEAFAEVTNGRLLRAMGKMMSPIKVPPLPKEQAGR